MYKNIILDHGVPEKGLTHRTLMFKISEKVPIIILPSHGNQTGILHSKKAGHKAADIEISELRIKDDLTIIFKCAKIIRCVLINTIKDQIWSFTGPCWCDESVLPIEIKMLNQWILQGSKAAAPESQNQSLNK